MVCVLLVVFFVCCCLALCLLLFSLFVVARGLSLFVLSVCCWFRCLLLLALSSSLFVVFSLLSVVRCCFTNREFHSAAFVVVVFSLVVVGC